MIDDLVAFYGYPFIHLIAEKTECFETIIRYIKREQRHPELGIGTLIHLELSSDVFKETDG